MPKQNGQSHPPLVETRNRALAHVATLGAKAFVYGSPTPSATQNISPPVILSM